MVVRSPVGPRGNEAAGVDQRWRELLAYRFGDPITLGGHDR
jgi:hypothetical protein